MTEHNPSFMTRLRPISPHAARVLAAAGLAACALPWVSNPGAGLTLGAYDLAEWISLAPDLTTSLLLRLQLLWLALLLALHTPHPRLTPGWWLNAIALLLLAGAQLPPLEFFTQDRGNPNYQQQFLLACVTLVLAASVWVRLPRRLPAAAAVLIALSGIGLALAALASSTAVMQRYGLPADVGPGAVLLIGLYMLLVVYMLAVPIHSQLKGKYPLFQGPT